MGSPASSPTPTLQLLVDEALRISRMIRMRRGPPPTLYMQGEPVDVEGLDEEKPYISVAGVSPRIPLRNTAPVLVTVLDPASPERPYYAVDGGHRVLEFTDITIVVSSVAVGYEGGLVVGATYPDSGAWPYLSLGGSGKLPPVSAGPLAGNVSLRFVATRPLTDPVGFLDVKNVRSKEIRDSFSSLTYGLGYSRQTMADENRTLLENAALGWCIERGGGAVIVDGPLYMIPGGLVAYFMRSGGFHSGYYELKKAYYLTTYMRLIADRVRYIAEALDKGIPLVAVVKRLVNSRLLVRGLASCGILPESAARDLEIVEYLVRLVSNRSPGVYLVGPILVVLNAIEVLFKALAPHVDENAGMRGKRKSSRTGLREGLATLYMFPGCKALYRDGVHLGDVIAELRAAGRRITGIEGVIAKRIYYLYVKGLMGSAKILRLEFPWDMKRDGVIPCIVESLGHYKFRYSELAKALRQVDVRRDVVLAAEVAYLLGFPEPRSVPAPLAVADRLAKGVAREAAWLLFQVVSRVSTPTYSTLVSMQGEGGGAAA